MNKIAKYKINITVNTAFIRKDKIKTHTGSSEKLFSLIRQVEHKEFTKTLGDMFEA